MESLRTPVMAAPARQPRQPRQGARITRPGPALPDGLVLDRYRLLARLGSGGFGVVWRAHDELLHREVAVKRIPLGLDGNSERASREALACARLAHPAIVALYEACAVGDAFYLISELVHGQTLAQLVASKALADEQALQIGVALAGALSHAHARGVIHRDVKPQNVLVPDRPLEPQGAAKLADFGGARLAGEDVLTRTGDVIGTLAYMAPEQSEGREVGEAGDLYALALVLYESLCGVNPVRGSTPAATARKIGAVHAPLERRREDLSRSLTRALDRAISPAPDDRGTLEELSVALGEALTSRPGAARLTPSEGETRRPADSDRTIAWPQTPAWQPAPRRDAPVAPRAPRAAPGPALLRTLPAPETTLPHGPQSAGESAAAEEHAALPRGPVLPRALWRGCALAVILWQAWVGRPGVALLALAAVLPLAALPRRSRAGWLSCALAPVLGLAGLANAFPAIAGQAARWRARAGMAALGYWWLNLAEPLAARRLWLGHPPGVSARATWEGSLTGTAVHVLGPMLSPGVLLGAGLWAAGAAVLPLLVRGRRALLDVTAAAIWSAAIVLAEPLLDGGLSGHAAGPSPRGAVLGAVLGGALAVAARALRGPV